MVTEIRMLAKALIKAEKKINAAAEKAEKRSRQYKLDRQELEAKILASQRKVAKLEAENEKLQRKARECEAR